MQNNQFQLFRCLGVGVLAFFCSVVYAQQPNTPVSQMEKLDRGLIAFPTSSGKCFVSWRLLGTDDKSTTFELLKNGASLKKDIYEATSMTVTGSKSDNFQIVTLQNGVAVDTTAAVQPPTTALWAMWMVTDSMRFS